MHGENLHVVVPTPSNVEFYGCYDAFLRRFCSIGFITECFFHMAFVELSVRDAHICYVKAAGLMDLTKLLGEDSGNEWGQLNRISSILHRILTEGSLFLPWYAMRHNSIVDKYL